MTTTHTTPRLVNLYVADVHGGRVNISTGAWGRDDLAAAITTAETHARWMRHYGRPGIPGVLAVDVDTREQFFLPVA